jgi:hypothetical protein
MAQVETRASKAIRRIGIVRANLAFLCQGDAAQLVPIYSRFAQNYRIPVTAMNRARSASTLTAEDCAAVASRHLDQLMSDASAISGINRVESERLNEHLHVLSRDCDGFELAQPLGSAASETLNATLFRFLARGMGTGTFAGSAL